MRLYVGLFVLILIVVSTTFTLLILEEKGTFEKRYNYHFMTTSADSFNIGMPLKFSGFKIGVIDNIELQNNGNVFMTFSVNEKNRKWIGVDTVLTLKKPLIGSAHIVVETQVGEEVLKEGSTLTIVVNDDINDMISKLEPAVERVISIIHNIDTITSSLAKEDSEFTQTLQNLNKFSSNLARSDSLLTTITGDKNSTQSLVEALSQTENIMLEIKKISSDLSQISGALESKIIDPAELSLEQIEAIFKDVKEKLKAIDGTVKAVGTYDKELIEIKEQISVGLQKSNQIIDKVDAIVGDEDNYKIELP